MQEDAAVVRKEMSLRRTFCLLFAIFILVQQRIFVCAANCSCRCDGQHICDEIERLKTDVDTHDSQLLVWNSLYNFVTKLKNLNPEDWLEKIEAVENEIDSIKDLKGRLEKSESRATQLEKDLEDARKAFENKVDEFVRKMQDVQSQAKILEGKITVNQDSISNIEAAMRLVEEHAKNFEPTSAADKKAIEQMQMNISSIEVKLLAVENQANSFKPAIEAEKRAREEMKEQLLHDVSRNLSEAESQFEDFKNDLRSQLLELKNETNNLKSDKENEKEFRIKFEEQLLHDVSRNLSDAESQFVELKNDLQSQLLGVKNETNDLKSDIEKEKEFRIKFEEQLLHDVSRNLSDAESQFVELKNDLQSQLLGVKNETNDLKSDIEKEKEFRIKFEEQLLLNVSSKHSEVESQFEEIKNDLQSQLLGVKNETDVLKSHIQDESTSWIEYQWELLQNISTEFSEAEKKYIYYNKSINDLQEYIRKVEDEAKSDVEGEKKSRIRSEEELRLNISATVSEKYGELKEGFDLELSNIAGDFNSSKEEEKGWRKKFEDKMQNDMVLAFRMKDSEFLEAVSGLEQRLGILQNQTDNFELAIKEEKEAREELEKQFTAWKVSGKLRRRRALESHLSEVRKHPSTAENKAMPLEAVISMEQTVSKIYR